RSRTSPFPCRSRCGLLQIGKLRDNLFQLGELRGRDVVGLVQICRDRRYGASESLPNEFAHQTLEQVDLRDLRPITVEAANLLPGNESLGPQPLENCDDRRARK